MAGCPIEKLKERGFSGVKVTENGGLDYANSNALYNNPERLKPDGSSVNSIVKIKYTGNYQKDFKAASQAGFGQNTTPTLNGHEYMWHHLDDHETGIGTMQLVRTDAHNSIPHVGGASQYYAATGKNIYLKHGE